MEYVFRKDSSVSEHGWIEVYDGKGTLLATNEVWYIVDDNELLRMNTHKSIPGNIMPLGDPRWYTHCQWCGKSVKGQGTAYYSGQYHYPACYQKKLKSVQ